MIVPLRAITVTAGISVLVACGSDQSDRSPWHESLPEITVEVTDSVGIGVAKVEAVPAPEIRIEALLQPDPNHVQPILAPATGILIRIAAPQEARQGDTLAIVAEGSEQAGREIAITAAYNGIWQPRRQPRQLLWEGEILGHLQERGFWWATGTVSDDDARFIHRDDPAVVFFDGELDAKHHGRAARVESITRVRSFYKADVAVEFRMAEGGVPGRLPITVIVRPSDAEDSLAAVPAAAVVQLPLGSAVFTPAGLGRYAVRWVTAGPSASGKVFVRDGVKRGASVVIHGLAPLVQAARDSLSRRTRHR